MKIAVCTDSGAGFSPEEAERLGVRIIPMSFLIDGKTYTEGATEQNSMDVPGQTTLKVSDQQSTLTRETFFEKLQASKTCSTSMPAPGDMMDLWDELLLTHDAVIYVTISSGLSGTFMAAKMLSMEDEYARKVYICDSRGVSISEQRIVRDVLQLINYGYSPKDIIDWISEEAGNASIYVAFNTLEYLKKGGRITPAAAAIGSVLKLHPILSLMDGGSLDACATARNMTQAKIRMMNQIEGDLVKKYHDPRASYCQFAIAYSQDRAEAEAFARQLVAHFPERFPSDIMISPLSLPVCEHIGPGGLGVGVWPVMDVSLVERAMHRRKVG